MKATHDPANIGNVELMFFRAMRKNFYCATLTGTAALAAFLASAGCPAQAARHHHHSDSSSQSASHHSSELASSGSSEHHRRHHHHGVNDRQASDTEPTPTHHHHHHDVDNDQQESSNTAPHHHRHHHESDIEDATAPEPAHRHHHHDSDADLEATGPTVHRHHRHRFDEDASSDTSPTPRHHHHHHSEDIASSDVQPDLHLTHAQRLELHVENYEAHLANVDREHDLRVAEWEAHENNVRETSEALHSGNVVRAAEAFRGTPYVMGGVSRSGFDCSGFTRYIFGESAGVALPRTADEQYYTGEPIAKDDLKAGDLVFFRDTYRHGISHVGMYIGNGNFVHACSPSRGVTISSLSEQYYINHYAGARRVMQTRETGEM